MEVVGWEGHEARTDFLRIDHPLDWDLLQLGDKRQHAGTEILLGPRPLMKLPALAMARHLDSFEPIVITRRQRLLLGDLDDDDALLQGFPSLSGFKSHWMNAHGVPRFSPHERIWLYDFHLFDPHDTEDEAGMAAMRLLAHRLFPMDLA